MIDHYYKYYLLSGVPAKLLQNEEHFNLYIKPKKEKGSEGPKVIVWKANANIQSDLCKIPRGLNIFL